MKLDKRSVRRNMTEHFDQREWDNGGGPFNDATLTEFGLTDITSSYPGLIKYCESGDTGGFYQSQDGTYFRADFVAGDDVDLVRLSQEDVIELGIKPKDAKK